MVRGLQLMYTPAATPESTGYQFVAETPGIEREERDMLEKYSTPSGPLTEGKTFSRATSIYKLPTGRVAISRLANVGRGYDGRPDAICTHTLVLSPEDFSGLFGHLSWISETLRPDPSVRGCLPMLELPADVGTSEIDPSALSAWAPDRNLIALGLAGLLHGKSVVIEDSPRAQDPLAALEVLLSLLPRWRREQISLCTFDVTVERPFDLLIVPEAVLAESSPEVDRVVVKLRTSCGTATSFGPYVDFAVGAAYERKWTTRTAFLRFFGTLSQGKNDIDACWRYWDRLEVSKPPSDPAALASYEADLSILSASVAPDRSAYHLGQAITRCPASPPGELMNKILFDAIPALGPSLDGPGLTSLINKALLPIAEHRDAKTLTSLFRQGLLRLRETPQDATLKKVIDDAGLSLLSCAETREEGNGPDVVELLQQAFEELEGLPQLRDLQERFILALAAKAGPANPVQARWTASRLKHIALDGSRGPLTTRLLAVAARIYHDLNDGVDEAIVEVTRFALNLPERPVPQLTPRSVDPELFRSAITTPQTDPAVQTSSHPSTTTDLANVYNCQVSMVPTPDEGRNRPEDQHSSSPAARTLQDAGRNATKEHPLPPISREALELFRHIAGHSGTPMGPVILSISSAFSTASRAAEGLLWIEAVADLPESKQWEEALFEASLRLCETPQSPHIPPSLALRTYWRLAVRGPPSNASSSDAWGERLHESLTRWTELSVGSPPLTVWDVVLAAGIPTVFLRLPPSDLSSWATSVRNAQPVTLGADAGTLLSALNDVLDSLKEGIGRAGEGTGRFMDRMRKRLHANPYEPPYVLLQEIRHLIPGAPREEES
jgi:hypothetical protein